MKRSGIVFVYGTHPHKHISLLDSNFTNTSMSLAKGAKRWSFRPSILLMHITATLLLTFAPGGTATPEAKSRASLSASQGSSSSSSPSSSNIRAEMASAMRNIQGLEEGNPSSYEASTPSEADGMMISDDPLSDSEPPIFQQHQLNGTEQFWQGNISQVTVTSSTDLYDVPIYLVVLLSLLYGAISVVSVVGNVLVLWVVAVSRRMRTKTNMFIANLALADIIIAIFAIPFQFQAALLQRWNLPHFMCAFCPFVQVLSVNVSVFTLSVIAMDRYRAMISPFKSIRISKKDAIYVIISIWTLSIFIALPQELDYMVIEQEDSGMIKPFCAPVILSPEFRQFYMFGLVAIQYVLPLVIISGAYTKIAAVLWGSNPPGNKEESRDENTLRNKKKVVKMLTVVVLLFALCWLPLQMYNFFQSITTINEYQYINIIWFCFHWLAMSNSCYNPFIYAIYSDKFQTEFKSRLSCLRVLSRRGGDDGYCSEASDFGTGGARIRPIFLNRSQPSTRREVLRISTIQTDNHHPHLRNIELHDGLNGTELETPEPTITTVTVCSNL